MHMKKKIVSAAFAVLSCCVATWAVPAVAADTLVVGVTTTGVPFTFMDTATQKPSGAMVDLAAAIAEDNGMSVQFEQVAFSALIPSLTSGKINIISAGMLATDKRREVVDFSLPVYTYGEGMFVAATDPKEYLLSDLKGEVVGAQIGTSFAEALKATGTFSEVKLYDSIADIMRDVKLGRIKAGFGDQPIVSYQISKNPDLGIRLVKSYQPLKPGDVSLAVTKDNAALLEKVNASIRKLQETGKLSEILAKYSL
mgnify:CR=1 FL=1